MDGFTGGLLTPDNSTIIWRNFRRIWRRCGSLCVWIRTVVRGSLPLPHWPQGRHLRGHDRRDVSSRPLSEVLIGHSGAHLDGHGAILSGDRVRTAALPAARNVTHPVYPRATEHASALPTADCRSSDCRLELSTFVSCSKNLPDRGYPHNILSGEKYILGPSKGSPIQIQNLIFPHF